MNNEQLFDSFRSARKTRRSAWARPRVAVPVRVPDSLVEPQTVIFDVDVLDPVTQPTTCPQCGTSTWMADLTNGVCVLCVHDNEQEWQNTIQSVLRAERVA